MPDIAVLRVVLEASSAPVSKELDKVDKMLKDFAAKSHPAAKLKIDTANAIKSLDAANSHAATLGRTLKGIQDKTVTVKTNYQTTGTPPTGTSKATAKPGRAQRSARDDGSHDTYASSILTASTTVPIIAGTAAATKVAIDFETAFTGVRKTVDGTRGDLDLLQAQLRDMASGKNARPVQFEELAAIAENAGQLGIATPAIAKFTRVMADLGQTTNLSSTEGATAFARLANITGMNQENFDRLGSTVVELGNKFAATEKEIADSALRIAGAGQQIGLSEAQILSFATALSSVGIPPEMGGSALSRVFIEIDKAARSGGESLDNFARVAGVSSSEFKMLFQNDAAAGVTAFITGLKRMSDEGSNTFKALEALNLSEIRVRDSLLRLSNAGDLTSRTLATGASAWQQNNALTAEAAKRYSTTASQMQIFQNRARETAENLTAQFLPVINEVLGKVGSDLPVALGVAEKAWADMPDSAKAAAAALGAVVVLAGPVGVLTGNVKLLATALAGLAGISSGAGGLKLALGSPIATAAAIGIAVVGYKSLKDVLGEVATAQTNAADAGKRAQKHLAASLDVLPSGSGRAKQITALQAQLLEAGDDAAKVGRVIDPIAALERQVKLTTESDIKTVVEHDLAMARRDAEAQRIQLRATVLMEPVWASVGTKVGKGIFGSDYQMGSDVRDGAVYNGIAAKIVDPISKLFNGGDDTPLKGDDWYSTMAALKAGSEHTRRQREAARQQAALAPQVMGPFSLASAMNGPFAQSGVDGARARATAAKNAPAEVPKPKSLANDWDTDEKTKRDAAALRLLKDSLGDAASAWDKYGDTVKSAADTQIEELSRIRGSVAGVVQELESALLKSGAGAGSINTFYKMTDQIKNQMGSERLLLSIYNKSRSTAEGATQKARGFQRQKELVEGKDGVVVGGSANVGNFDSVVMNAIIAGVKTPMGKSACARFVSKAFDMLGVSPTLKRTDVARNLVANARKAGAKRIPASEAGAGDILFAEGPNYGTLKDARGNGVHVGIGVGNGMFVAKNRDRHSKIAGYGWTGAYDTSALAGRGGGGKQGTSSARASGARPSMPNVDYDALQEEMKRPQFAAAYTKYANVNLQDMLRLHHAEKEGNAIRRNTLLSLAELTPELHKYAAAKGLDGKAAETWVQSTRAALYSLANYTEGVTNANDRMKALVGTSLQMRAAMQGAASEQIGNVKGQFKDARRESFLGAEYAGKESQFIAQGKSPFDVSREMELYRYKRQLPENFSDRAKDILVDEKRGELDANAKRDRLKDAADATADYTQKTRLLLQMRNALAGLGGRPEQEIGESLQQLTDYHEEYNRALLSGNASGAVAMAALYQSRQADLRATQQQIDKAKELAAAQGEVKSAAMLRAFSSVERDPDAAQTRFDRSMAEWDAKAVRDGNVDPAARIAEQDRLRASMGTDANDEINRRIADLKREKLLVGDATGEVARQQELETGALKNAAPHLKAQYEMLSRIAGQRQSQIEANEQVLESEKRLALAHATSAEQRLMIERTYADKIREARGEKLTPEQAAMQDIIAGHERSTAQFERVKSEAERMRGMFAGAISTGFSDGVLAGAKSLTGGILDQILQEQSNRWATQITRGIYGRDSLEDSPGSTWGIGRGPAGGTPGFVPDSLQGPYRSQQSNNIASGIAEALGVGGGAGGSNVGAVTINAGSTVTVRGALVSVAGGGGVLGGGGAGSQPSLDQVFGMLTKI